MKKSKRWMTLGGGNCLLQLNLFLKWFGWCFNREEQDIILDNIFQKTGLKLYFYEERKENGEFLKFINTYKEDFKTFAEDFIEDTEMKNKFISFCQKK